MESVVSGEVLVARVGESIEVGADNEGYEIENITPQFPLTDNDVANGNRWILTNQSLQGRWPENTPPVVVYRRVRVYAVAQL